MHNHLSTIAPQPGVFQTRYLEVLQVPGHQNGWPYFVVKFVDCAMITLLLTRALRIATVTLFMTFESQPLI